MIAKSKDAQIFYSDPDLIAEGLLCSDFVYDPGGDTLRGAEWTLRYWRDDFYHWQDSCWVRLSDAEIKRIVVEHIQNLNEDGKFSQDDQKITITTYKINNVVLCLKGRIGIPESVELNTWPDHREKIFHTIAVKNGLLLIDRRGKDIANLHNHTPEFFGVTKLPYDYDPKAECPHWLEFLNGVMQDDQELILLLQQWTGYLFRPDLREQKFLLCTGEGANGKGVFFEVTQALVGEENCSQVGLARFGSPFALYSTLGKVVNVTNESSHIVEDEAESVLKSFVAGDRFTFERKFKEPVYAVPTAKVMIATNALPRFNDKTQAIWRRILLVPFDKVIPDEVQKKDLAKRLKRELPGVLNWALVGLQKLHDAGGFIVPEKSKEFLEEYRGDADPARSFLLENYMFSPNGWDVSCTELYNEYTQWCQQNGCKPMNNRTFGRHVRRTFPEVQRVRTGGRDNREWMYKGLVSQVSQEIPI